MNNKTDWYRDAVIYHIYPLGMTGAPEYNPFSGQAVNRIAAIAEMTEHIADMGFDAVYFGPVFSSTKHGYDTADYRIIDERLGTNDDFAALCRGLHDKGIRVILDGVFNHVGRDFFAFRDVREKRENSPYRDWFNINFGGDSCYGDGFWYEGWEGHFELVKLNLHNFAVREHIFSCIGEWIDNFGIDGLRLDVAYLLDEGFLCELRNYCLSKRADFFLLGESIHGDYNRIVNDRMLHSATNYECYKGIHSSLNSANMHEIGYSLNRQFGPEHWCIYRGKSMYSFVDNHDVSRIASILGDSSHIALAYGLIFTMPGIPSVYYG
ncbi:MAG: maltodextrin glucosidase, partial [Clostridia bacterium]|nr:maltodextrin glucosidase [Clostridia bacterium]